MLEKNFDPKSFEKKFLFDEEAARRNENAEPFMILLPPPNVTGSLHVGHSLCYTLQDIVARYKRLKGYDVLFQPGLDHAGIVTQLLVEKQVYERGIPKGSLTREALLEEIWAWKEKSGCQILGQMKVLGISCDFSRLRFTMDEGSQKAVAKLFVNLYDDSLIYRGERMVNWDPLIRSAISDLEVIEKEIDGNLWHLKYKLQDSEDFITVATTRPETIFGDVAVAVNPADERYKDFIGKTVLVPLINRPVQIIADEYADPAKGSGAVKITPAHDFNDFEVGKRHNLPASNIMNANGELDGDVPEAFQHMDRFAARKLVVELMEKEELVVKTEKIKHKVPFGDRSGVMLEPRITRQWFIDAAKLAVPAIEAVKNGDIKFTPKHWENLYFEWMNNIEPWCISRQIWWGHRIPAWYGPDGQVFVAENIQEAWKKATTFYGKDNIKLVQDEDVLDTWYSSGMWPFVTLGWPENTKDLQRFYSNMLVVTGFDIIFFWIARMIMMGLHANVTLDPLNASRASEVYATSLKLDSFSGASKTYASSTFGVEAASAKVNARAARTPFRNVYIHALVRDEKGNKMSKSKGNVIDPLKLCDVYGADALRYTLASMASPGRDIKMGQQTVEIGRNFLTKLWNAVRFAQMNDCASYNKEFDVNSVEHPFAKWIVHKIRNMITDIENSLDNYRFDEAARHIYQCVWNSFCDWYMEFIKPILQSASDSKDEIREVTSWAILQFVRVLYPIAPFISKKLSEDIGVGEMAWPDANAITLDCNDSVQKIDGLQNIISSVRSIRKFMGIPPSEKLEVNIETADPKLQDVFGEYKEILLRMAGISAVDKLEGQSIPLVLDGIVIHIRFDGKISVQSEKERLNNEIKKLMKDKDNALNRLNNNDFLQKASEEVVQEHRDRVESINEKISKMEYIINVLNLTPPAFI
ncbi:valine--tRNA ligase [Alphaproteobacteria bacterium]|nr:valine--tRNA ligase [Alphaproteobacteria bacterium]